MTSFARWYPRYRSIAVNWHRAVIALIAAIYGVVRRIIIFGYSRAARLLQELPSAHERHAREIEPRRRAPAVEQPAFTTRARH